ncbi:SRPBCC family protein [Tateyamaria pelophila]|uniref:SRPBCC family protein n=1 Tax=Tateyamaria pelophila TaxID=328415 RepID=UPI001CBC2643|nr:SRPBCC domain-containing protein [Tateyamaria pelophila]
MTATNLTKTIYLAAPRTKVWDYLTQPEHLAKWFHAPKAPMIEGQKLEMFGTESGDLLIWGTVSKAQKPDYLEYTFTVKPMGDTVSIVKWTLTEVPGGTQLSLVHEGLPQDAEAFGLIISLDKGWDDHLMRMRTHVHDPA